VKKSVVIISPFATPNIGGVETHLDKLTRYAVSQGFYVVLLTYQPLTIKSKGLSFEQGDGFEIHRINWIGNGWFPKLEPYFPLVFLYLFPGLFFLSLSYFIKNFKKVGCIHAHGLVAATIVRILGLLKPMNLVVSTHAVYGFSKRRALNFFVKSILQGFNTVLAVSEVSRNELINMGLSSGKVRVHPNWVEVDTFNPAILENNPLKVGKRLNILFVGRFLEHKGVLLILKAAKELPDIAFHIVGSGPLEDVVKKASESYDHITYYGSLMQNNEEQFKVLLQLYGFCDYLLSPYLYDEGFSATLVESLAMGTPVIVSDRGSPPTFLNKSVAKFLSYQPTSQEIVALIKQLGVPSDDEKKVCRDYAVKQFGSANAQVITKSYT
jgi:glycosyltransferase involved in cell wall biosynthesis